MNIAIWRSRASNPARTDGIKLSALLPHLRPFNNVMRIVATKANRDAFDGFLSLIAEHGDWSVEELISAIEAIEPPKKAPAAKRSAATAKIDQTEVDRYAARLAEARSDIEAFKPVFSELQSDKRLSVATKKAIASAFIPGAPKFTSAKAALEAIEGYMKNLNRSRDALKRNTDVKF